MQHILPRCQETQEQMRKSLISIHLERLKKTFLRLQPTIMESLSTNQKNKMKKKKKFFCFILFFNSSSIWTGVLTDRYCVTSSNSSQYVSVEPYLEQERSTVSVVQMSFFGFELNSVTDIHNIYDTACQKTNIACYCRIRYVCPLDPCVCVYSFCFLAKLASIILTSNSTLPSKFSHI